MQLQWYELLCFCGNTQTRMKCTLVKENNQKILGALNAKYMENLRLLSEFQQEFFNNKGITRYVVVFYGEKLHGAKPVETPMNMKTLLQLEPLKDTVW